MPSVAAPVRRLVLLLALGVLAACSSGARATEAGGGASFEGEASYVSDRFAGNATASGEPYDPQALTAAHRTLPFGTRVRVRRLDTGAEVVVRVNDRGPFVDGRVIDLSRAAAERLAMLRVGVVAVRVTVLDGDARPPSPRPATPDRTRRAGGW
jgi:rare lipoprotein A